MPTSIDQQQLTLREDCESLRTLDRQVQEAMSGVDVEIQDRVEQMRGNIWAATAGKIAQDLNPALDTKRVNFALKNIEHQLNVLLKILSEKPGESAVDD